MKSTNRRAASAAGFLALSLAAPLAAQQQQPQRGSPPNADTPYIIITTFRSNDRKLGVEMADELRKRVTQEHSAKELFVVQKNSINGTLEASGYRADSALAPGDIMELAKGLRGEIATEGSIDKTANGVHVDARVLMKYGQVIMSQPLPAFDAKDAGDAAKQLERAITESNKALASFRTCKNSAVAAKFTEAAAAARAGIAAYPNSTFNRICLLNVMASQKAGPDEIIAVATQLKQLDPNAMIARGSLADAYMAKGDTTHAIEEQLAIYRIDPTNTNLATTIVQTLAQSGAPDKALPIIDTLLVNNPGDPAMLRTKFLLQARLNRFKDAMKSGEEWVKADTAAATADYYQRQIGIAQSDSNAAAVLEFANKAAQKFPKEITFPLILAQAYVKAGQMQQALAPARRATQLDPKNQNAWLLAIAAANGSGMKDSTAAYAKAAIAAGLDKATFASALAAPVGDLVNKANASKQRADWDAALAAAKELDATASSAASKFYLGLSAFSVAGDLVNTLQEQVKAAQKSNKAADKAAACATVSQIEDNILITQTSMPAGGSISKEVAGQVLNGANQISEFNAQVKKGFSCK